MKQDLQEVIEIPEGVTVTHENGNWTVAGEKGTINRRIIQPKIAVTVDAKTITLDRKDATQREKRHIFTMRAHIRNMLRGAQEGHTYKLKVCSGHFPMNVSIANGSLTVKNFLGEAVPRVLKLKEGADVKIDGDIITVFGADKEIVGQVAADIEQLTRITNRDTRIFQDGLYIIEKDGSEVL